MKRRVTLYFVIAIATGLCLLFSCSPHRALEKSLIKYLSQQGLDVASVEISKEENVDSYVCVVPISGLIKNYTVEEVWDVTFNGKEVGTASRRAVTDSTRVRAVNSGSEYSLAEYIEEIYFPQLADPSYQGAPYVDSLLRDEAFYLRHREAWLSTVPIGDRAIYQVRGPVKTLVTNLPAYYSCGGADLGRLNESVEISFNVDGVRCGNEKNEKDYRDGKAVYCILWKWDCYSRWSEGWGEEYEDVLAAGGIKYNENGLVTYYRDGSYSTVDGQGGPGVSIEYRLFYDQLGNCIKKKTIFYEEWDGGGTSYKYEIYKILKTDRLGNWTERRRSDGGVEKRIIVYYTSNEMDDFPRKDSSRVGYEGGYEWADLGLSVKWATRNVGASRPEEYGNYYSWGETSTSHYYGWSTYKLCRLSYNTLTKYCTNSSYGVKDYLTKLEPVDDAARYSWGTPWRMPTKEEFWELIGACRCSWVTQNNVRGMLFTSKMNGNSIFLPAAGYMKEENNIQSRSAGYYWTSSLIESKPFGAYRLWFKDENPPACDDVNQARYFGMSIRPVLP